RVPTWAAARPRRPKACTHSASRPGGTHNRKARQGKQVTHCSTVTRAGTGSASRSRHTPSLLHSSSMASEPSRPAMLTSLAATTQPAAAPRARQRSAPGTSPPALVEGGEEGEAGPHRPLDATADQQRLAGPGGLRGQRPVGPAEPEGRQPGRTFGDRQVTAHHGDLV